MIEFHNVNGTIDIFRDFCRNFDKKRAIRHIQLFRTLFFNLSAQLSDSLLHFHRNQNAH